MAAVAMMILIMIILVSNLHERMDRWWGKELLDTKISRKSGSKTNIRLLITGIDHTVKKWNEGKGEDEGKAEGEGKDNKKPSNLWENPVWQEEQINLDVDNEIKEVGEKTWWIEQVEIYLSTKKQMQNIILLMSGWVNISSGLGGFINNNNIIENETDDEKEKDKKTKSTKKTKSAKSIGRNIR